MGPALATARGPEAGRVGEPAQGRARGDDGVRGRRHPAASSGARHLDISTRHRGSSTDLPGSPRSTVG